MALNISKMLVHFRSLQISLANILIGCVDLGIFLLQPKIQFLEQVFGVGFHSVVLSSWLADTRSASIWLADSAILLASIWKPTWVNFRLSSYRLVTCFRLNSGLAFRMYSKLTKSLYLGSCLFWALLKSRDPTPHVFIWGWNRGVLFRPIDDNWIVVLKVRFWDRHILELKFLIEIFIERFIRCWRISLKEPRVEHTEDFSNKLLLIIHESLIVSVIITKAVTFVIRARHPNALEPIRIALSMTSMITISTHYPKLIQIGILRWWQIWTIVEKLKINVPVITP